MITNSVILFVIFSNIIEKKTEYTVNVSVVTFCLDVKSFVCVILQLNELVIFLSIKLIKSQYSFIKLVIILKSIWIK